MVSESLLIGVRVLDGGGGSHCGKEEEERKFEEKAREARGERGGRVRGGKGEEKKAFFYR